MTAPRLCVQPPLFGHCSPSVDRTFAGTERRALGDGAWIELRRGWVSGHAPLFDQLLHGTAWRSEQRAMYERRVTVPRQLAVVPEGPSRPPLLEAMRVALDRRYGARFERVTMAVYRDGADSVAWHGDTTARDLDEAIVATVSLGEARRFLLKPAAGGASMALRLGWGDLLVMGGTCQRTWRHCVPKTPRAGPRIAIMFRPVWEPPGEAASPRPAPRATDRR